MYISTPQNKIRNSLITGMHRKFFTLLTEKNKGEANGFLGHSRTNVPWSNHIWFTQWLIHKTK